MDGWARLRHSGPLSAAFLLVGLSVSAAATPQWAREYGMPCAGCHTVPPRLNDFGRAFQANHLSWPAPVETPVTAGLRSVPLTGIYTSGLATARPNSRTASSTRFMKLVTGGGFHGAGRRPGGYYLSFYALSSDRSRPSGEIDDAYISLPVAGRRGETAVTIGQAMPLLFQWSPHNTLTRTYPGALQSPVGGFSLTGHYPCVRLDWFSRRGEGTAEGDYLSAMLPFDGELTLSHSSSIGAGRGILLHAFRRRVNRSYGLFGFRHGRSGIGGVVGTADLPGFSILGIAALGRDERGAIHRLTVETDRYFGDRLALTARLEVSGGVERDIAPVIAVTHYPWPLPILRLTAEWTQRKGDRSLTVFGRIQF